MPRMAAKAREFRYAIDLDEGGSLRDRGRHAARRRPGLVARAPAARGARPLLAQEPRATTPAAAHIEVVGRARLCARALHEARERRALRRRRVEVELAVRLTPKPGEDELAELLAKAERDCFIGASLTVKPTYRWTVALAGLERRERQPVPAELLPVELGLLLLARPHDRLAASRGCGSRGSCPGRTRRPAEPRRARTRRPRTCCGCRSGRSRSTGGRGRSRCPGRAARAEASACSRVAG